MQGHKGVNIRVRYAFREKPRENQTFILLVRILKQRPHAMHTTDSKPDQTLTHCILINIKLLLNIIK
jgi:hypothetical protein